MVYVKPKRPLAPVPFLQSTINEIVQADNEQRLTSVLEKFDSPYHFERPEERNLLNWYKVLNRFDELLDRYVNDRNIFQKPSPSSDPSKQQSTSSSNPILSLNPSFPPSSSSSSLNNASRDSNDSAVTPFGTSSSSTTNNNVTVSNTDANDSSSSPRIFTPSQNLVLLILRHTERLIRNSSHDTQHAYNSIEHISALLADDSTAINLLGLEILDLALQRSYKFRSTRIAMTMDLSERLLELSLGWGGRESDLGLLECCSLTNEHELSSEGKKLMFEYNPVSKNETNSNFQEKLSDNEPKKFTSSSSSDFNNRNLFDPTSPSRNTVTCPLPLPSPRSSKAFDLSSLGEIPTVKKSGNNSGKIIYMKDASLYEGDERWLLNEFAVKHGVPRGSFFSLLCAFRRARRFAMGRQSRIEASILRLYSLMIMIQVHPIPGAVHEIIGRESELIQDLLSLAKADESDGVHDIPLCLRMVAIRLITAMTVDRHRFNTIISVTGADQHHGTLPTLLRTQMNALLSASSDSGPISKEDLENDVMIEENDSTTSDKPLSSTGPSGSSQLSLHLECARMSSSTRLLMMMEVLLSLVNSVAVPSGSSGANPLVNSGILSILIPALSDRDPSHARVVAQAIRTMQVIIDGSTQSIGSQLFRDQDGLALVAERIAHEVGANSKVLDSEQNATDEAVEVEALRRRNENRALYERLSSRQMTVQEALDNQPPSSSAAARGLLPHSKWSLLRALHQLLGACVGHGGNEIRQIVASPYLPNALRRIFGQPFKHGGILFCSAATVTTNIAHAEPTATGELVKAGITEAVLKSIRVGLPPCGEAVRCVPSLLAALCLAPSAREIIVKSTPLKHYLLRLATPFYSRAMHGEIPLQLGNALDELMRHVEALRPEGNRAMCEYLNMSATFVSSETTGFTRSSPSSRISGTSSAKTSDQDVAKVDRKLKSTDSGAHSFYTSSGPSPEGESTPSDIVLLDKMKLSVANNSCRLAGFHQGSSEHQEGIISTGGLKFMIELRLAPALACPEATVRENHTFSRHYPTPAMTTTSLVTTLRNLSSRHGTAVLKNLFRAIMKDAFVVLQAAKDLEDRWLPEEDDENEKTSDSSKTEDKKPENRKELRLKLEKGIRKLRVDVVLLSGLSRGGPGSSSGDWETAGGVAVATVISTVERAVRTHLATVYSGLTLRTLGDGDLGAARVSAAMDPSKKPLRPDHVGRLLGNVNRAVGCSISKNKRFEEICKSYEIPIDGLDSMRCDVKGLAWHMVTFAVAAQKMYSTLSKGLLINSRRLSRDPNRYNVNLKSLASTIGRIFALHFKAAAPLWNKNVRTMGNGKVVAAWDYIRGVIIAVKGTLFDEPQSVTQGLMLRSFLEAGGGEALFDAIRPALLLQAASPKNSMYGESSGNASFDPEEMKEILDKESIVTSSMILALGDFVKEREEDGERSIARKDAKADDENSLDSVSKQARAMSRMVVSDKESFKDQVLTPSDIKLRDLLKDQSYLSSLKYQTEILSETALEFSKQFLVRKIAADSWSTVGSFLQLLASCPSLSNSSNSSDVSSNDDWTPNDIHRSSLNVVLQLMGSVASQADDLLAVRSTDGTALTDMLGIVNATSSNYQKLCQKPGGSTSHGAGAGSGSGSGHMAWEDLIDTQAEEVPTLASRPLSPDPESLQSLVEMGFPERRARRALIETAGAVQFATEWLLNSQGSMSDQSDDEEEEDRQWNEDRERQQGGENAGNENMEANNDDDDDDDNDDNNNENNNNDGANLQNNVDGMENDDDDDDEGDDDLNRMYEEDFEEDFENTSEAEDVPNLEANDEEAEDGDGGDETQQIVSQLVGIIGDITTQRPQANRNESNNEDNDAAMERDDEEVSPADAMVEDSGDDNDFAPPANEGQTESRPTGSGSGPASSGAENSILGRASHGRIRLPSSLRDEVSPIISSTENSSRSKPSQSVETDGKALLQQAAKSELYLLRNAFKEHAGNKNGEEELKKLCEIAADQTGVEDIKNDIGTFKAGKQNAKVSSIPVDRFKARKKEMFEGLAKFVVKVVRESNSNDIKSHVPYIIVELLSALNKDGCLSAEYSNEFGTLLTDSLKQWLIISQDQEENANKIESSQDKGLITKGQPLSLWTQYGGWKARRWMEQCGAFRIAMDFMCELLDAWREEDGQDDPSHDDASEPIKKLKISDGDSEAAVVVESIKREVVMERSGGKDHEKSFKVRAPTNNEVQKLSQLTTCLLVIDARIRNRRKDNFIGVVMKKVESANEEKKKKESKMEVDNSDNSEKKVNETNGAQPSSSNSSQQQQNRATNDYDEAIRTSSDQRPTSSAFLPTRRLDVIGELESSKEKNGKAKEVPSDVVMKSNDTCRIDIEKEKAGAAKERENILKITLQQVSEMVESEADNGNLEEKDHLSLIQEAMKALNVLKRLECGDAMIALLQLLGSATREWKAAELAINLGIVEILLTLPHLEQQKVRSVDCRVVRSLVRTILRHVLEDEQTLMEAMCSEIREVTLGSSSSSSSRSSSRSMQSIKALMEATTPLAARNLKTYICAMQKSATINGERNDRSSSGSPGTIKVTNVEDMTRKEAESRLEKRTNVRSIVNGLCKLLVIENDDEASNSDDIQNSKFPEDVSKEIGANINKDSNRKEKRRKKLRKKQRSRSNVGGIYELPQYALRTLADMVEFSRVAATALIKCESPNPNEVEGNAIDYIAQRLLRLGSWRTNSEISNENISGNLVNSEEDNENRNGNSLDMMADMESYNDRIEVCNGVQRLFTALCCKTAGAHTEAVDSFARAVALEASKDKKYACSGIVKGVAQCIVPGTRSRVIRAVMKTDLANDLAICLDKLDIRGYNSSNSNSHINISNNNILSNNTNNNGKNGGAIAEMEMEVSGCVLRALSLIGDASTQMARHGDFIGDDVSFGGRGGNAGEAWMAFRDRDEFMVI